MWFSTVGHVVILALLMVPGVPEAQPPGQKVPHIGILTPAPGPSLQFDVFRHALRQLGYVEGQNLLITYRSAEGRYEQLPALAAELVRLQVDVLVTQGTPTTQVAKRATSTIPIVVTTTGDPVEAGLVASWARPGGNITGFSLLAPELNGKRLELLKEVVPTVSRVLVLSNPANPIHKHQVSEMKGAASALGMALVPVEVRGPDEFASAFQVARREGADALVTVSDSMLHAHHAQIVTLAAQGRLPGVFPEREFAAAGGLMAYGPIVSDNFRRAATYVDKILKGAKPADLPVEQPTQFELVINLKTAQALGLTIPPTLLFLADEVIR